LRLFRKTCVLAVAQIYYFARFIAHIGQSLYGEHTFAAIKAKAVFFKKFALVALYKKQGFHATCGESETCDRIRGSYYEIKTMLCRVR
jgi:hypothetical protein